MFRQGDWAFLIDTGLTLSKAERVLVQSIPDGTHIKVKDLKQSRAATDWVSLSIAINSVYCQCKKGNGGSLYIGMMGIVKATYANVVAELLPFGAAVQPIEFTDTRYLGNGGDSSEWWIDGTTADGYLPSFGVQ